MFGLNGPVKEVLKTSPSNDASASTVETVDMRFKPNGQLENESCRYNEAGYPVSVKIDDPNFNGTVMVEYSADNRCSRYVMEIDKPMAMTITTTNEYRDGKLEYSTLTPQLKDPALADMIPGGMPPFNLEYSNVEYDSHGNWVKRDLKMIFPRHRQREDGHPLLYRDTHHNLLLISSSTISIPDIPGCNLSRASGDNYMGSRLQTRNHFR